MRPSNHPLKIASNAIAARYPYLVVGAGYAPERLPQSLRARLESPAVEVFFSAASIWEIAIKSALGKIKFHYSAKEIADGAEMTGFIALPVSSEHAAGIAHLPMIHSDPFDRLLIAQALAMPARFVTADAILAGYSELVDWIGKS